MAFSPTPHALSETKVAAALKEMGSEVQGRQLVLSLLGDNPNGRFFDLRYRAFRVPAVGRSRDRRRPPPDEQRPVARRRLPGARPGSARCPPRSDRR